MNLKIESLTTDRKWRASTGLSEEKFNKLNLKEITGEEGSIEILDENLICPPHQNPALYGLPRKKPK